MDKFRTFVVNFFFNYNWEIVEIEGAIFKISWGIWLLLPFQTFKSIQGYAGIATENYWGWGLLLLGTIHLLSIASGRLFIRRWITFIAFLFWIFTVVLIWSQAPTAALLPLFSVIAFFMGLNFLRLGIEIKARSLLDERKVELANFHIPERHDT